MGLVLDALLETLRKPTHAAVAAEVALLSGPLWAAVLLGLLIGWTWRPRWAADLVGGGEAKSGAGAGGGFLSRASSSEAAGGSGFPRFGSIRAQLPRCINSSVSDERVVEVDGGFPKSSNEEGGVGVAVTAADLEYLSQLVEVTDGGPVWRQMMDRSLPNMSYQAWRRDPERGPPQYRSRTIFEDATPETVRDFFWDDKFRMKAKWDEMLIYHKTLEECKMTGTMIVHWVRKFPFFCSDREYIIGRRIWESGRAYYCVTKSVPYPAVPRQNKPRRVDLYYSSWCIRAVESRRGDGQMTACEVLLFHYEDMGIPWEIAKLGVRQGMWGCVKKIEPGLRAYQVARRAGDPLSQCAFMEQINTKVSADYLRSLENDDSAEIEEPEKRRSIPRFLVVGGAVVLACTLDKGLLTKALIFGIARRFLKPGR